MFFRLIDVPHDELYYKQDQHFKQPKAIINIHIIVPSIFDSIVNQISLFIFIECMKQELNKVNPSPGLGKLPCSQHYIDINERGFSITLQGFNDKLSLLLKTILDYFKEFEKNFDKDKFSALCEQARKNYYDKLIIPGNLANDIKDFIMKEGYR